MFTLTQNRWKIDDVLGVWPLHGLCGAWGGIAAGIFGSKALGGTGRRRVRRRSSPARALAIAIAAGRRPRSSTARSRRRSACASTPEEEFNGADLTIHKITRDAGARAVVVRPARRGAPYVRAR